MELYGRTWPDGITALDINLYLFRESKDPEEKYTHGRKAAEMLWPEFIWSPWSEKTFLDCCSTNYLGLTGSSAASKSHTVALFLVLNWLCSPANTFCMILSTTLEGAKLRIWKSVKILLSSHSGRPHFKLPGQLMASPPGFMYVDEYGKPQEVAGLRVFPSERGKAADSCSKIQGIHAERLFVVVDEATGCAPSIAETIYGNSRSNPYFWCSFIGNPDSKFDPHGQFCTPVNGWESVSVDDESWECQWREERGLVRHFDAMKNPNYIARENIYPFLQPWETIEKEVQGSGHNSAYFWKMFRGFWSATGNSDTVFSEADILQFEGTREPIWIRPPLNIAGLDPAFTLGGDRCMAAWLQIGTEANTDRTVVYIKETAQMREDVTKKDVQLNIQRIQNFRKFCEDRNILPKHAGYDSTGGGIPYGELISQVWSSDLLPVSFNGLASERVYSSQDPKKGFEQYANRVTELIFNAVQLLRNKQLCGITPSIMAEWTSRRCTNKTDTLARLVVESKRDFKSRVTYSPDETDAILVAIEVARQRLNLTPGGSGSIPNAEGKSSWTSSFARLKARPSQRLQGLSGAGGWNKPLHRGDI